MECVCCQAPNHDARRFCGQCGSQLSGNCRRCGFVNDASDRYCGGCGDVLSESVEATPGPKVSELKAKPVARIRSVSPAPVAKAAGSLSAADLADLLPKAAAVAQPKKLPTVVTQDDLDKLFGG